MKSRYIVLSKTEQESLITLKRSAPSSRVMERCHALLLSSRGYHIAQLCAIFSVGRDTITNWFNRWESEKFNGLEDRPKSGRPCIFNEEDKKKS